MTTLIFKGNLNVPERLNNSDIYIMKTDKMTNINLSKVLFSMLGDKVKIKIKQGEYEDEGFGILTTLKTKNLYDIILEAEDGVQFYINQYLWHKANDKSYIEIEIKLIEEVK